MRPGICMECGTEFCRTTEKHSYVDCINNLKKKISDMFIEHESVKRTKDQFYDDFLDAVRTVKLLFDENVALKRVEEAAKLAIGDYRPYPMFCVTLAELDRVRGKNNGL